MSPGRRRRRNNSAYAAIGKDASTIRRAAACGEAFGDDLDGIAGAARADLRLIIVFRLAFIVRIAFVLNLSVVA